MNALGLHNLPGDFRVWFFSPGSHRGLVGRGYERVDGQSDLIHGHAASGERSRRQGGLYPGVLFD